jgi:hypothetical protein
MAAIDCQDRRADDDRHNSQPSHLAFLASDMGGAPTERHLFLFPNPLLANQEAEDW